MSDVHPVNGRPLVAAKLCGGCRRRVADDAPVGEYHFCEWTYRFERIIAKRLPLWKRRIANK